MPAMRLQLVCLAGETIPDRVLIDGDLDLGRDPHCDLRIVDESVSRYHARIVDGELMDNQSSNGTWVEGGKIDRLPLKDGLVFAIGSARFAVVDVDAGLGATRVLTDDGVPLEVTNTEVTRVWQSGDDAEHLAQIHTAIRRLLEVEAGKRGQALADRAASLTGCSQAAFISGGRVQAGQEHPMSQRLGRRLAGGREARLLVLGRELVGKTIAAEAVGSAASAPVGELGYLVVARDIDADPLEASDLHLLAQLAAEAIPCLPTSHVATRELIGSSAVMEQLRRRINRLAQADATVLITGASGTGKELVARALHRGSARSEGPFVTINCAAVAESLVEAELFGHERGAFTGAAEARPGRFRQADGGTLFLDEVGEMPLAVQAKLLRTLQEGEVHAVGSTSTVHVDVRVLAATNRNLQDEVDAGRFRADLFYRLDVIRIHTPDLSERLEDLPELVPALLRRAADELGVPMPAIAPEVIPALQAQAWPGNVRQLANCLTRALVLADTQLQVADLELNRLAATPKNPVGQDGARFPTLADMEARHVLAALTETKWNKSAAARLLAISRPTLHKKIADYGLRPPEA